MKKSAIALLVVLSSMLLAGAARDEQRLVVNPGARVVAERIAGSWIMDKHVTRLLNPDAAELGMMSLDFTSDPAVLKRLQNHETAGFLFRNRRIVGAGMMTIGCGIAHPYVLVCRDGNLKLMWFQPTNPSTDPLRPAGLMGSMAIFIAVSRAGADDMLFLGGESLRTSSACYYRP
jgi:hypothetical protein